MVGIITTLDLFGGPDPCKQKEHVANQKNGDIEGHNNSTVNHAIIGLI